MWADRLDTPANNCQRPATSQRPRQSTGPVHKPVTGLVPNGLKTTFGIFCYRLLLRALRVREENSGAQLGLLLKAARGEQKQPVPHSSIPRIRFILLIIDPKR